LFKDDIVILLKNKNTILFLTALLYIIGLFGFYQNCLIPVAIVVSLILISLFWFKIISVKQTLFWIFIFYLAIFNATNRTTYEDYLSEISPIKTTIEGRILSIPNNTYANKSKFFFEVNKIGDKDNLKLKTLVTLNETDEGSTPLKVEGTYKIKGLLKTPLKQGNPSQFDYGKYLRNYNVHTVFYANSDNCIEIDKPLPPAQKFIQTLNFTRESIINTHSKYLKSPNLEVVGGIVFGDDAVAPPEYIKKSFINSGLLHILAASGMNVAFIFAFWFFLLSRLKVGYKIKVATGIFVVLLYAMMTGLGASVIRATIMLVIILIGKLIDRDTNSVSLLGFVALLMLIINPAFINDVGFQLSFVVTFGILVSMPVIEKYTKKIPQIISGFVFIPVVAQIWVIPIQMFYFNTVSTYSIFANILSSPILAVISFGGFISSILAIIKPIANFVCMVFDFVLNPIVTLLLGISNYFSQLPHSLLITIHPSLLQIFLYYAIILSVITVLTTNKYRKHASILTVCLITVLCLSFIRINTPNTEIIVFDVQNADSFLIKTPQGKYIGIDTGKSGYKTSSQAKAVMLKYMKDRGIKNIESLIITHFDNDHAGGAVDYIKDLNIKQVYVNSLDNDSNTAVDIYEEAKKHENLNLQKAVNNSVIYEEPNFKITNYFANMSESKSENENSIISMLETYNFKMLFMGDAGIKAYYRLKNYLNQDIDILKAGHHGAFNVVDYNMLKKLKPEHTVISVGANKFGHPNRITLEILKDTDILRTDEMNSLKIVIDKRGNYSIYHFDSLKNKYVKI